MYRTDALRGDTVPARREPLVGRIWRSIASYFSELDPTFWVAIAPALVETPMSKRAVGDEQIRNFIRYKQPLDGGRVGAASDLDEAAVFFLSDASRYVTGQVLAVDGGWSVSEGRRREG